MHDIIISNMINAERNRLEVGNNRPEEMRPLQSVIRGVFSRFSFGKAEKPRQKKVEERASKPGDHTTCACNPAG